MSAAPHFSAEGTGPEARVAYEAARLRWAQPDDADTLAKLWAIARDDVDTNGASMRSWLENGGALMLEDPDGRLLCALRWREEPGGWRVDRIATVPDARGQGYGRWLMTKVEALAIRYNVARLRLDLDRPDLLPYYERLGYREVADRDGTEPEATVAENGPAGGGAGPDKHVSIALQKRVGGTWQVQEARSGASP